MAKFRLLGGYSDVWLNYPPSTAMKYLIYSGKSSKKPKFRQTQSSVFHSILHPAYIISNYLMLAIRHVRLRTHLIPLHEPNHLPLSPVHLRGVRTYAAAEDISDINTKGKADLMYCTCRHQTTIYLFLPNCPIQSNILGYSLRSSWPSVENKGNWNSALCIFVLEATMRRVCGRKGRGL